MKILIPWSGGLDSTYLVWKRLTEGHDVYTEYFEMINNYSKVKRERAAIEKLRKLMPNKHNLSHFDKFRIGNNDGFHSLALCQPPAWIYGVAQSSILPGVEKVEVSYVLNDCAVSFMAEINACYDAMKPFMMEPERVPSAISFPLIKIPKSSEIRELPVELLNEITFCEYCGDKEDFDNCGECVPCKHFKDSIQRCGCPTGYKPRFQHDGPWAVDRKEIPDNYGTLTIKKGLENGRSRSGSGKVKSRESASTKVSGRKSSIRIEYADVGLRHQGDICQHSEGVVKSRG